MRRTEMKKQTEQGNPVSYDNTEKAARKVITANLRQLIHEKGISQKRLAELLEVAPASMTDYLSGKRIPPVYFFLRLKKLYGISLEDFLTKSIQPSILPGALPPAGEGESPGLLQGNTRFPAWKANTGQFSRDTCRKYCGSYFTYYFDTSKYKGRDTLPARHSLLYGVFFIYENPSALNMPEYSCAAVMGFQDPEDVIPLKEKIDSFDNPSEVIQFIGSEHAYAAYYGSFELGQEHAFISLQHTNTDRALIILHRVDNNKPDYTGGIGTINSISRGRERMPVIQFIGFSRTTLSQSEEEIEYNLLLNSNFPSLRIKEEMEELIRTFKMLYIENKEICDAFTEVQKATLLRSTLERAITKNMIRNMYRYGKVSERDDDAWYHAIKQSKTNSMSKRPGNKKR